MLSYIQPHLIFLTAASFRSLLLNKVSGWAPRLHSHPSTSWRHLRLCSAPLCHADNPTLHCLPAGCSYKDGRCWKALEPVSPLALLELPSSSLLSLYLPLLYPVLLSIQHDLYFHTPTQISPQGLLDLHCLPTVRGQMSLG